MLSVGSRFIAARKSKYERDRRIRRERCVDEVLQAGHFPNRLAACSLGALLQKLIPCSNSQNFVTIATSRAYVDVVKLNDTVKLADQTPNTWIGCKNVRCIFHISRVANFVFKFPNFVVIRRANLNDTVKLADQWPRRPPVWQGFLFVLGGRVALSWGRVGSGRKDKLYTA